MSVKVTATDLYELAAEIGTAMGALRRRVEQLESEQAAQLELIAGLEGRIAALEQPPVARVAPPKLVVG